MTEPAPNDPEVHAEVFRLASKAVSKAIADFAAKMEAEQTILSQWDVARLFLSSVAALMVAAEGPRAAAWALRETADMLAAPAGSTVN